MVYIDFNALTLGDGSPTYRLTGSRQVPTLRALVEYLGGTVHTTPRDVSPTGHTIAAFAAAHKQSGETVAIIISGDLVEIHIGGEQQSAMFMAGVGLQRVGGAWLVNPTTFAALFGVIQG